METIKFENDECFVPVTMEQFQDLTNEILTEVNRFSAPNFLSGDYMAQILMSALHSVDKKTARVKKSELFEACMNRICNHVTFHAVQAIQQRLAGDVPEKRTNASDASSLVPEGPLN